MNKKVLVITLALVVALAGSAMASVNFSGSVTLTAKQENFKVFQESFSLEPKLEMSLKGSNKNVTSVTEVVENVVVDEETGEEIVVLESVTTETLNWDFTAELGGNSFALAKYKLGLYDNYFQAHVWGNKYEYTAKATYFDMIKATSGKDEAGQRARLIVPVMDLATVTADFAPGNNLRAFVDGKFEGYNFGLAYARKGWKVVDEKAVATDVLVAQVGGAIPAGDLAANFKAAAGVTLGDDLGYAFGLSADAEVMAGLKVDASVTNANKDWKGDDVKASNTVVTAGASYEQDAYKATAKVTHTMVTDKDSVNKINLGLSYRFSETLGFADLFKADKWYTNDAPAVNAYADIVDFKLEAVGTKFGVQVAAPVVDNMVWAKAYGEYGYYEYADQSTHKGGLYQLKSGVTATAAEKLAGGAVAPGAKPVFAAPDYTNDFAGHQAYLADLAAWEKADARIDKYAANDKHGRKGYVLVHEKVKSTGFKVGADLFIQATPKLTFSPYASYAQIGEVLTLGSKAAYKVGLSDTTLNFEVKKVKANDSHLTSNMELIQASVKIPF